MSVMDALPMPPLPPPLPPMDPTSNGIPLPPEQDDRDGNEGRRDWRRGERRPNEFGRERRDNRQRPFRDQQGSRNSPLIGPIDPSRNNAPLDFDINKDKPPMPVEKNGNGNGNGVGPISSEMIDQNQDNNQVDARRQARERRDRDRPRGRNSQDRSRDRSRDRDRGDRPPRNNRDRNRPNNMAYGSNDSPNQPLNQPGYSQWGGNMGANMWPQGNMAGGMGQMTGQMPAQAPGQMPAQAPGQMTGQMPGQMGQMTGQMTGQMGQMTPQMGQMTGQMGQMTGQMPGQPHGQMPGQAPGQMPGQAPGQMTGQMPGQMGQMTGQMGQMGNQMGHMGQMAGQMVPMSGQMGSMGGQMGPMGGQMPQMGGQMNQMGGQMGQMGMGTMGPMNGPLSGEFRITWGMFGWMMSPEGLTVTIKNQINCKTCVLTPPAAKAPPATRERPLGCRTVFVGGLPENINEDTVRDVFERCGEITNVRLSKKNFCHIRYELEEYIDNAIFLSGYKMRINDSSEKADTGRLHCDYAQAREDQYEYEMRQRQVEREQRHYERMEQERLRLEAEALRPPSPPPISHYSDHEASLTTEQLKVIGDDETFEKAAIKLVTWLDRGDCNKRNAQQFYNMVQSTNTQVRRILEEKSACETELARFKEQIKMRIQGSIKAFSQIERVFNGASHQKVKDHFTKAQRRNIEMWKKQAQEIKNVELDDSTDKADDKDDDEEMDVSDDEATAKKAGPLNDLKDENYNLRTQLLAYENDLEQVKIDLRTDVATRDDQIDTFKKTLSGMQQQLLTNAQRKREDDGKYADLAAKLKKLKDENKKLLEKAKSKDGDEDKEDTDSKSDKDEVDSDIEELKSTSTTPPVNDKTAELISMMSNFLHVHTKGASVDYIWSYIQQYDKEITPSEIQNMLSQYPTVYRQITTGVGASLERKWLFIGYKNETQF